MQNKAFSQQQIIILYMYVHTQLSFFETQKLYADFRLLWVSVSIALFED